MSDLKAFHKGSEQRDQVTTPLTAATQLQAELRGERRKLRFDSLYTSLTALGLGVGVALQLAGAQPLGIHLAFALAFAAGGVPAGVSALSELLRGRLDIDLLMVLAALAAAAVGEARDGAVLLFLFSLASTLEAYALGNTKRAVAGLMKLRPDTANLLRSGQTSVVSVDALKLNDAVLVKPGERIPADGVITKGESALDQASVTGESVPVDKTVGDSVFSGTVNGYGVLELRVTKRADESTLARMIELVTEAQAQRSPSERFSDWFGQRYTVLVLVGSAAALGIFLVLDLPRSEAFYKAATLLVVASPCAIVISVPAAVLSALTAAARRGVLFKGGAALEDFGAVSQIAFDKTGTLTLGRMSVAQVVPFGIPEAELLKLACTLESHSEHPLAASILEYAEQTCADAHVSADLSNVTAVPGKGLLGTLAGQVVWAGNEKLAREQATDFTAEAEAALKRLGESGQSLVIVGRDSHILGIIGVADSPRPGAKTALNALRAEGLARLSMLTGDHQNVAQAVAHDLGIRSEDTYAQLLPEDKVNLIKTLSQTGGIAFVGDGVNDAAALATANVGVAMGVAGSDVAIETADVALLSDDLEKLAQVYALARRSNRVIKQNLVFALGIMVLMVILTLFFTLPLPLGVIGHEGGTLLVVANGLRLLAWGRKANT